MGQVEISFENQIDILDSPFPSEVFPKLRKPSSQMISIVTPTYNERENIRLLIEGISQAMSGRKYEIIVVDDNSSDGTGEIAKQLSKDYPVKILMRNGKFGLASAILTGFEHAKGKIIGVIDADLQHPPEYLLEFVKAIEQGDCDVAVGSRYTNGGGIDGWTKKRLLTSKVAVLLAKPLVGGVHDPMSGFFFLKRSVIEGVRLNPTGYKLGLEILVKGKYRKLKEIPYTFKQRKNGASKLNKSEIFSYLRLLKDLYLYKIGRQHLIRCFKQG
jgi:dolichol-phosphate mannosyltransferase